jgi:nitroreductase
VKKKPLVQHSKVYKARELARITFDAFGSLSVNEQLTYLAGLSHLAPSTHNTQPWRFFLDNERREIAVFLDRQSVLPASDSDGRQAVISVGCAIENIMLAGEFFGMRPLLDTPSIPTKTVLPVSASPAGVRDARLIHLSTIRFKAPKKSAVSKQDSLFNALWERKVVRAEFDPAKPISRAILHRLKKIADGKRIRLQIITDAKARFMLAELQAQADAFVFNDILFTKELGRWFLPNDSQSQVGIPGIGFGFHDAEALRIHRGLIGETTLEAEDSLKFSIAGKRGLETSPAICLLTVQKDTPEYWLEAGRVGERMFLYLSAKGIHSAIHAGIVEVPLINRMFAGTFNREQRLAVLFRAGYVKDRQHLLRPHSPRLSIDEILLKAAPGGTV